MILNSAEFIARWGINPRFTVRWKPAGASWVMLFSAPFPFPLVDPIMPVRLMAALFRRDFGMQRLIITPLDYDGEKWELFRGD